VLSSDRLAEEAMMARFALILLAGAIVGACSLVTIADRYGNQYGGWYNHGASFAWQRDFCEGEMERESVPAPARKLAMRCCMRDHGVPVEPPPLCEG
jgi:hypothetical protein